MLAITVDRGPDGSALNSPFVSVTVCRPGTTACQTVNHVLVDSASYGLRLKASVVDAALALPAVTNSAGAAVGECAHFATGYVWGSVRRADVQLSGEVAASLPLQIISDPATPYATVPASCRNTGGDFGAALDVNGILGLGMFAQDCPACTTSTAPGTYFACTAAGCSSTVLALASQVSNPVPFFPIDNNGLALTLPDVPLGGAPTLTGSIVFGIGTQTNNQLGAATVYTVNSQGNFSTRYKGRTFGSSFIDSGSNAYFFSDASLPLCAGFFCPPSPLSLSAVNTSSTGVSGTVNFVMETLPAGVAAAHVGADVGLSNSFDWGLPFFFGRTVFVALVGATTPRGNGPYVAY
jgi:hypothetical protein